MSKYTPDIVAVLRSVEGPFNLSVCQELAQREDFQEAGITAKGIISLITNLVQEQGTAAIIVDHNPVRASTFCNRVLQIRGTKLEEVE